ncbi:MAG TPA: glycosyltransferase family 4 protein [Bacillales bacterium]|nr:glycosyltransferase family 4 protein [Bacillales bacterium]
MNIAFICTESLPSPAIRGGAIQTMIDGVAPYLTNNHDLTIFSVSDPALADEDRREGIRYIRVRRDTFTSDICEHLSANSFDLIHVFNRPAHAAEYKAASPGSCIVLGMHNEMLHEKKISEPNGRRAVETSDGIAAISHYIKKTIVRRFPSAERKIDVVYSGVDLAQYPPVWSDEGLRIRAEARSKFGLTANKVLLFAGRLSKNKGVDKLIRAMPAILRKHPDAVLVVAGGKWFSDNSKTDYIRSLHRLAEPLKERVIFTEYVPQENMPELFLAADVFVCTSQWPEPLARVHYEAMAAGTPVITTNRGGNGEAVLHEQNGLLIDAYDRPAAFVSPVHRILKERSFARWMAKNGRTMVELNFQFSHTAERLERLYRRVTKNEPGE